MNILVTSHKFYPDVGGLETVAQILCSGFTNAGHSIRLITQSSENASNSRAFPFDVFRRPSARTLIDCYRWADLIFQNNLEVRQLWPQLLVPKPMIISLQTWVRSIEGKRRQLDLIKQIPLLMAKRVISCSEEVRKDSWLRSVVIGNPYNDSLFRIIPGVMRTKSIVFLGRLVSDKGMELFLKAYASINSREWPLTIIGDGPERRKLEALTSALNINNSVRFIGAQHGEKLVATLNRHELMVVPSLWREPFGVVALEGLACGCIILASDGGGLPEAVGPAGILFKRGDLEDLSKKLKFLTNNKEVRQRLRSLAVNQLRTFRKDNVCKQYLRILAISCKNSVPLKASSRV